MIQLIGIPYDANSSYLRGASQAPGLIRRMGTCGSSNPYAENGEDISPGSAFLDLGDISPLEGSAEEIFNTIRGSILSRLEGLNGLVSLGGDHSVTYPVIDALTEKYHGLTILHLDAHPDLYDSLDGNPYSHASSFARIMEKGRARSLVQVGIRGFTPHQREQAARLGVTSLEMKDFDPHCVQSLVGPLYLSLDLDVLDPAFAPGVSHHEPGGLTTRELIALIQAIEAPLIGADIVELNPARDVHTMTAMAAYKLLKEIIARMLRFHGR
jgi:arginase